MFKFIFKLLYLTKGRHNSLLIIAFLLLIISGLEVVGTGMIGPFIAVATNPGIIKTNYWLDLTYNKLHFISEQYFLFTLGVIVLIAFYAKALLSFEAQKAVIKFSQNLRVDLQNRLLRSYLKAPYTFHLKINSATVIQNIVATTDTVCTDVVMPCLTAISNILIILALSILLIKISVLAMLEIAILLPILVGLIKFLKNPMAYWSHEGWLASKEILRILNHSLGGLKEIRIIGCESYFEQQMEQQTNRRAKNFSLSTSYGNIPRFVIEAFMMTFLISFTLLYINLNPGQEKNLTAVLGIFGLASIRLLPAISNLVGNVNNFRANAFAIDKLLFDFKEIEKSNNISGSNTDICYCVKNKSLVLNKLGLNKFSFSFRNEIILDRLSYQYPNGKNKALDKISLTIQKGQSVGLIGKSGSGKTTLGDVILGLFIPQLGDIKVDGISVYQNLRAWQNMLGYVPQSIFLTEDTLERNIAFGVSDEHIDRGRLKTAIEMAQLTEVVEQLPDGIKTVVGERGVLLSGGQRQRVGIARVLYHQREILVFDEATAALDTKTEKLVTEAIKALSGTKTIIIIAHRFSTIEHCDRIYQLEQGRIIKSGTYQEVVMGH